MKLNERPKSLFFKIASMTFFALAINIPVASAATIWSNAITGDSSSNPYATGGDVKDANVGTVVLGAGTGVTANAGGGRYNFANWGSSHDLNDYFYWTLTPNSGFKIDFTTLTGNWQRSSSGPASYILRSSADGFVGNVASGSVPSGTAAFNLNLGAAAFDAITSAITFRLYGFGSTGTAGTFSINDFVFNGAVSALATPDIDPAVGSVSFPSRIVGAAATQAVALNEVGGTAASYTSSMSGDAIVTAGASGPIAANGSGSITVGISTASAGPKSGIVTLDDGNSDVDQISVSGNVFDPSLAAFLSNGGTSLNLNLGTFLPGSGVHSIAESISNVLQMAGYTAELDFDSIAGAGDTAVLFTDLINGEFSALAAGTAYGFSAMIDTGNAPGTYSASYTLGLSDADAYVGAGAAGSQTLTLNVTGTIVPEPASWTLIAIGMSLIGFRRRTAS
jgi:hypothetical protein